MAAELGGFQLDDAADGLAVEQEQSASDADPQRQCGLVQAALELVPALVFGKLLFGVLDLPQRHRDRPGQAVPTCPGQEVADGVALGRPLVSQASTSAWLTIGEPVPRWSSQARKSTATRICWRAHDPDASVNVRVRARLRARRSTIQRANGRDQLGMLRGHVAEQVIEPGVDVFDAAPPGRAAARRGPGPGGSGCGLAAGEGVEQLVGQRPVVAGERGQDAGAVAAAPARSACSSGSPRRAAPRGSGPGARPAGSAEQLVDTLVQRAPGAQHRGPGRRPTGRSGGTGTSPGARRRPRRPPGRPGRGWSAPGAARSRGRAPGWPAAAGSSCTQTAPVSHRAVIGASCPQNPHLSEGWV